MNRVNLASGDQALFLEQVKQKLHPMSWDDIAQICGVSSRTLRNWRLESCRISYDSLIHLHKYSSVPLPFIIDIISDNVIRQASGRMGGEARFKSHGPLGTLDSRRKGGQISYQRRLENEDPSLYQDEFKLPKSIYEPQFSVELAELVGILLGDGQITQFQVKVTLNVTEAKYGQYVADLIYRLFNCKATLVVNPVLNVTEITLSAVAAVGYLEKIGLKIGNKVQQQVSIPSWIFTKPIYSQACVRGLVDTDGSVYLDVKTREKKTYNYLVISFSNRSRPLLSGMFEMLQNLGFNPKHTQGINVRLLRQEEVHRYFTEIGSSNSHHSERYQQFCKLS